jgi:putative SOS response-associated peptidase YedK
MRECFGITEFVQLRLPPAMPRFNVAPTSVMPVVVEMQDQGRVLTSAKWGFQPAWMAPGKAPPPINARAASVATNGLFKRALSQQRCIVPATGFWEWMAVPGEKRKAPRHIRLRDGEPFGFGGIYTPPTDEGPGTYAIVTTRPNEVVAPIHNRMPVILGREWEALWLDPDTTGPERVLPLLEPYPGERMEAYRVGYDVGTSANDREDLLTPRA